MRRAARVSAVVAFAVLLLIGSFRNEDQRKTTPSTFGTQPLGYRALFDLLTELGYPVERSYDPPDRLSTGRTVWWVEPSGVCRPDEAGPPRGDVWPALRWVEGGGRAVVFLPRPWRNASCPLLDTVWLPARPPGPGLCASGRKEDTVVTGDVPRRRRVLERGLFTFADAGDWIVRARLGGRPFVLERPLGLGQLVVVADAAFLHNRALEHEGAAPLAVDLIRAFGIPRFDEERFAPGAERGAVAYLATSPVLALFVGLALTGLLFAWHEALMPPRAVGDAGAGAPRLETFVDSLAALYAATRDHRRVFERYREMTAGRLRRHFGLGPDMPLAGLVERLRRERRAAPTAIDLLTTGVDVADETALRAAARVLDGLVREATT